MISIIVACSKNNVIGNDNKLIWHLPNDLKRFKRLTNGNPILMGRKTFESIGRPLPNRINIILTRDKNFKADGCIVYNNIEEALEIFHTNLWVIGGSEIYNQFLPHANSIEMTLIDKEFEGDSYFPELDKSWNIVNAEQHTNDEFSYSFISMIR